MENFEDFFVEEFSAGNQSSATSSLSFFGFWKLKILELLSFSSHIMKFVEHKEDFVSLRAQTESPRLVRKVSQQLAFLIERNAG